jgi:hypothetical protein
MANLRPLEAGRAQKSCVFCLPGMVSCSGRRCGRREAEEKDGAATVAIDLTSRTMRSVALGASSLAA